MTSLADLQERAGVANGTHGFNEYDKFTTDEERNLYLGNKLMLVVSELSEAQDELRSGHKPTEEYTSAYADGLRKPEGFPAEIADAVIRLLGIAYELKVDTTRVMENKMAFNEARAFRHGKQF